MTETETQNRELDGRVAFALGWRVVHVQNGPTTVYEPGSDDALALYWREPMGADYWKTYVPNYSTDPTAADLVIKAIEARGWDWEIGNDPADRSKGPRYAQIHGIEDADWYYGQGDLWQAALCLAFLAADEAEKGTA